VIRLELTWWFETLIDATGSGVYKVHRQMIAEALTVSYTPIALLWSLISVSRAGCATDL